MVGLFVDGIAEFYNETDEMIRWSVTKVDCHLEDSFPLYPSCLGY